MKRKILLQYSLAGAIVGYFVFHPLIMLFSYLMTAGDRALDITNTAGIMDAVLHAFAIEMVPWSISFALLNGIIGLYYGTRKAEKIAREELIVNLQKALADVKILSGMMPICEWCKKTGLMKDTGSRSKPI